MLQKLSKHTYDMGLHRPEITSLLPGIRGLMGELKGYTNLLPNPLLLLSPAIVKESLASSEIENIHTTLADVLQQSMFPEAERTISNKEVLYYREAILWGYSRLPESAITTRVVLGIYERLMPYFEPGYRKVQNKIANLTTGETVYMPPQPQEIAGHMGDWETWVNSEVEIDPLIKAAVAHYQFEAIHPLLDGNGRTGRILMVLQLIQSEILALPVFYISGYINAHKSEYYRALKEVSERDNWVSYLEYMLKAMGAQAKDTIKTIQKILALYNDQKETLQKTSARLGRTRLLDQVFAHPVITPMRLGEALGIHYTTATRQLLALKEMGIISDKFHGKYHLFVNHRLLEEVE